MRLTATHYYNYHRPSLCELRVHLNEQGLERAPLGPYEEVLRILGERHESNHLSTFPDVLDLTSGPLEERVERSREAIHDKLPVIYHPLFKTEADLYGSVHELIGEPDFLLKEQKGYVTMFHSYA